MKKHYGLGRARWLGEDAMAIQAALAGAVHNYKKILKFVQKAAALLTSAGSPLASLRRFAIALIGNNSEKLPRLQLLAA